MTHDLIYEEFKTILPELIETVDRWEPAGLCAIKIYKKNGEEIMFMCFEISKSWALVPLSTFIEMMEESGM